MVYRLQLTFDEIIDILDWKYIPSKGKDYSLQQCTYKITGLKKTLQKFSPDNLKVTITVDDIRLKSNLNNIQNFLFTKNSVFYTKLGLTQPYSGVLGDIEGFVQLIPGPHKSHTPININGIDKNQFEMDCFIGSIVDGIREPILYTFGFDNPPAHNIYKELRIKL